MPTTKIAICTHSAAVMATIFHHYVRRGAAPCPAFPLEDRRVVRRSTRVSHEVVPQSVLGVEILDRAQLDVGVLRCGHCGTGDPPVRAR
jgi:hypothetical protein